MKKMILTLALFGLFAKAAPPPWATLVAMHAAETSSKVVFQYPGSPINCTDTPSPDWCLTATCATVAGSGFTCATAPIGSCLAYQVSGGTVVKMFTVDPAACAAP